MDLLLQIQGPVYVVTREMIIQITEYLSIQPTHLKDQLLTSR